MKKIFLKKQKKIIYNTMILFFSFFLAFLSILKGLIEGPRLLRINTLFFVLTIVYFLVMRIVFKKFASLTNLLSRIFKQKTVLEKKEIIYIFLLPSLILGLSSLIRLCLISILQIKYSKIIDYSINWGLLEKLPLTYMFLIIFCSVLIAFVIQTYLLYKKKKTNIIFSSLISLISLSIFTIITLIITFIVFIIYCSLFIIISLF